MTTDDARTAAELLSPANRRVILPTVQQVPVSLDRAEMPCVDCFVGEPHVCPLLTWGELVIEQDEWGGYVVADV